MDKNTQLRTVDVEAICGAMLNALRNEDNWTDTGVNWDFIDADTYAAVRKDVELSEAAYYFIFELHADMFAEDYDGLTSFAAFHNKMVDEVYNGKICS